MTSEVVSKDFLMAVINEARLHQLPSLTIRSILLDLDLLSIDLVKNEIHMLAGQKEFHDALSPIRSKGASAAVDDLPNYEDLRTAVWHTVLLPDEVTRPICDEMEAALERRNDPYRYPRQVAFAIDTNIAYHRLFSRIFLYGDALNRIGFRPRDVQVIVSNLVEEEISRSIARKYSRGDIAELQRAVRDQVLVRGMNNICYKKGRKALNAQTEIDVLGRTCGLWRVGGGKVLDEKESIDDEIVRSLAEHSADQRLDVIFLTGDDKCRAHAFSHKLPSILVEYPKEIPQEMGFDPWLLVEMLYDLSVSFVGLQLVELDLKIIGDWSGKSAEDYHAEKVKLVIAPESPVKVSLKQDLEIIRDIQSMDTNSLEKVQ
ncbi:MAG: hypothetical protein GX307_03935 [Euryarchaeota archaeon]|nr:hypothetical protein [Euryarchaeota archaeon]